MTEEIDSEWVDRLGDGLSFIIRATSLSSSLLVSVGVLGQLHDISKDLFHGKCHHWPRIDPNGENGVFLIWKKGDIEFQYEVTGGDFSSEERKRAIDRILLEFENED